MKPKCETCNAILERSSKEMTNAKHHFCSKTCQSEYYKTGETLTCDWCGKHFYKSPSKIRNHNLCSAECRNRWLGKRNLEILNVPGHSKGHKAPHLRRMNQLRNPLASYGSNKKYVSSALYRKIASEKIGRKLYDYEDVHHINGDRSDNRPENIVVLPRIEHHRLHMHLAHNRYELEKGGDAICQKKKLDQEE